jgi:hypothetical protein
MPCATENNESSEQQKDLGKWLGEGIILPLPHKVEQHCWNREVGDRNQPIANNV